MEREMDDIDQMERKVKKRKRRSRSKTVSPKKHNWDHNQSPCNAGRSCHSRSKDKIRRAFAELKGMMEESGYYQSDDELDDDPYERYPQPRHSEDCGRKRKRDGNNNIRDYHIDRSETTIYRPAIQPKRVSLSSDDQIDTSNETVELDLSASAQHLCKHMANTPVKSPTILPREPSKCFIDNVISDYRERSHDANGDDDRGYSRAHSRPPAHEQRRS